MPTQSINLFTRKLMAGVLESFESKRVISKTVNTSLLSGAFGSGTGTGFGIGVGVGVGVGVSVELSDIGISI